MTFIDRLKGEPALILAVILAVALRLGVEFGENEVSLLSSLLVLLLPVGAGIAVRQQVTPAAKVDAVVNEAVTNAYREFEAG